MASENADYETDSWISHTSDWTFNFWLLVITTLNSSETIKELREHLTHAIPSLIITTEKRHLMQHVNKNNHFCESFRKSENNMSKK